MQVGVVLTIVTDRVRGEDKRLDRYIARVEAVEGVKVVLQPNTVSMTVRNSKRNNISSDRELYPGGPGDPHVRLELQVRGSTMEPWNHGTNTNIPVLWLLMTS